MSKTGAPQGLGDFKEYTNGQSDAVTWAGANSADWIHITGAGSTVVTTEAGAAAATPYNRTITTDASEPSAVYHGPIVALVSTTATRVRMGIGAPPLLGGPTKITTANGGGITQIANMTALQALAAASLTDGQRFSLQSDGSEWRYAAASVLTTDTSGPFLVATATTAGAGAFLRVDKTVNLLLPATFANADASVLWTVPTGWIVQIGVPYWHITTTFAGGSSSAIGLSSSNAGCTTKGDLLGGSGGDVTATLVSTGAWAKGTVGAKIGKPAVVLIAADTIRYDQITSTYTSGVGVASVPITVLLAPAA